MAQWLLLAVLPAEAYRPPSFCTWSARHAIYIDPEPHTAHVVNWQDAVHECDQRSCWAISQNSDGTFWVHQSMSDALQANKAGTATWTCEGDCSSPSFGTHVLTNCWPTCETFHPSDCESGILKRDPALGICHGVGGVCDVEHDASECCGVLGIDDVNPNDHDPSTELLGVLGIDDVKDVLAYFAPIFSFFCGFCYFLRKKCGSGSNNAGFLPVKKDYKPWWGSSSSDSDSDSSSSSSSSSSRKKKKKKDKKDKKDKKVKQQKPDYNDAPIAVAVPVDPQVNARSKFCASCGAQNEADVAFCHNCGKQMT